MDTKREPWMYEKAKKDVEGRICTRCGGVLGPIETVDNAGSPTVWPGCNSCQVFNYGTTQELFDIARELVVEHNHVPYIHMGYMPKDEPEREHWIRSQTAGAASLAIAIARKIVRAQKGLTKKLIDDGCV